MSFLVRTTRQSLSQPKRPEPATDDDPISSSEEDNVSDDELNDDFEVTPKKTRQTGPTLEQKLAAGSQDSDSPERKKQKKKKDSPISPGSSRKRSFKESFDGGDGDLKDDVFAFLAHSSQPGYKRHSYGSRARKSSSFRKTTSSSMPESISSSAPGANSAAASATHKGDATQVADDENDSEANKENREDGFKVPPSIDLQDPTSGLGADSGFKQPPDLPPNNTSSASSAARDLEILDSDDDSPLSSALSCASFGVPMEDEDEVQPEYLCPMCREPVEPALLIQFQSQPRQRIRDQQKFCKSHRNLSAEKEWADKGYPTIDWDRFDERIQSHFDDLEKILVPDSASYYRNVLDTSLKSGQAKNFRLSLAGDSLETISCGYYGTRGAGKMLQAITTRFARKLRRLAVDDHIVKKAGVVVYSQAVLVPELAVRLIKEDMDVDDDSARQIMRESILLGEKLNPALNDTVPVTEETDDVTPQN